MISDILKPPPTNLKHQLILASPILESSIFGKSCILMTEQNEAGHEGYIINHKTNETLGNVINKMKGSKLSDLPVYLGGPVHSDSIHLIALETSDKQGLTIHTNIKMEHAEYLVDDDNAIVLPCLGYSGWSPRQLKNEFEQHTWYHRQLPIDLVSRTFELSLWKDLLEEISPYHSLIAHAPNSPLNN